MRLHFKQQGKTYAVELNQGRDGWEAFVDGARIPIELKPGNELELILNGETRRIVWAKKQLNLWLHVDGHTYELERIAGTRSAEAAGGERVLRAPMPGQVTKVFVQAGDLVKAGGILVLLEAMKMEVRIQAPWDAKVSQVNINQGQSVEKEQVLVELEPDHAG